MIKTQVLVIGSGPGGYTAAFRAADLGKEVVLVENHDNLGGVCLNVGCIPSKSLLHTAQVINEAKSANQLGINFASPKIDINGVRKNKETIVNKLTAGIQTLAKARKVKVLTGYAKFLSTNQVKLEGTDDIIEFEHCVIAAGSRVTKLPMFPFEDKRLMDSTDALLLDDIPKSLLIVGGGIIGLEMATIYDALGSEITIVELCEQLIPTADKDIINPLFKRIKKIYSNIFLNTKVTKITAIKKGIKVSLEGKDAPKTDTFDKVLVSIGRSPNGNLLDAKKAGVDIDKDGFIATNRQMKTNVDNIFAIGDIVGQPMLAHKAEDEGIAVAEIIAGQAGHVNYNVIPAVIYTSPEVAMVGKTEEQLKKENIKYNVGKFPFLANSRAKINNETEGFVKIISDEKTDKVLGVSMISAVAGTMIAELALAMEFGASAEDIARTCHAHPTHSEAVKEAAMAVDNKPIHF